jgi:hypothetical protein
MMVLSQKMQNVFIIYTIFILSACTLGQNCNRQTIFKEDQNGVPKEVCLPKDYIISYVYSRYETIDFNNDGYSDYVFAVEKDKMSVGDSSFLFFYKVNSDSTFSFVKKFDNIFPIYFDSNEEHPDLKDEILRSVFECYNMPTPLYSLEITGDMIVITRSLDGRGYEKIKYTYKYNKQFNDWILLIENYYSETESRITNGKGNEVLSDFSYCNR